MGLSICWTALALAQFADRLDSLGAFSPDGARRLRRKVDASLRHLLAYPELGRWVPEFGPGFYREILVKPLRLLYENHGDTLVVIYVHRQEEAIGPDTFAFEDEH